MTDPSNRKKSNEWESYDSNERCSSMEEIGDDVGIWDQFHLLRKVGYSKVQAPTPSFSRPPFDTRVRGTSLINGCSTQVSS